MSNFDIEKDLADHNKGVVELGIKGDHRVKDYCKKVFNKKDIFSVPNILCYVRILIAVIYLVIYLYPTDFVTGENVHTGNNLFNSTLCGLLILSAGFTDFVDGFIARKFKLQSHLGKIIDPFADKLLQLMIGIGFTVSVCNYHVGWNNFYLFPIMLGIFILKEGTLFFANIFFFSKDTELNGATWYGKFTTFFFYVNMGFLVIFYKWIYYDKLFYVLDIMVALNIFFISIAYILYWINFIKIGKSIKKKNIQK